MTITATATQTNILLFFLAGAAGWAGVPAVGGWVLVAGSGAPVGAGAGGVSGAGLAGVSVGAGGVWVGVGVSVGFIIFLFYTGILACRHKSNKLFNAKIALMDSIIIFGAKYLFVIVALLFVLAWLQAGRKQKLEILLAFIIAGILALVMDKIAAKLYYDPRPFVSHHLKPLVAHAADNGFPSEHTLFTITLSTIIIFYRKKLGIAAFVLALLVGIGRVAAHVHSPIDIVGGIVFGVVAGIAGYFLARAWLPGIISFRKPRS